MATALAEAMEQAAKVERTDDAATPARVDTKAETLPEPALLKPDPAPLPPIPQGPGTGVDPQDFVRAHRIHIKDGSLFIDPYLVIHPRELDPSHEAQLRKKLRLTYSINNPSFFESSERTAIALNLGQLVPVSLAAKRSQLLEQVKQFNSQVDNGTDASLQSQANDKRRPFAAIVRDTVESGTVDAASLELLKNGLGIYLLVRQKLTENGYYNRLSDYVKRMGTADQVLGDLADNIGVTPLQVREAALKGGIDGVGKLLGLAPDYIKDAKQVAEYAATQDFGYNLVEHWHLGRQLLGPEATLQQKITAGMDARITAKIGEYRARVRHHYDTPIPVQEQERRIGDAMKLVEPIQRKLLYALGYEICFSPEQTADDIAFHRGIYGLHRKSANDLRDIRGTYRIYFSGKGDLEGSMRTLCHEIAHNFWPAEFTPKQVAEIDALANADAARFTRINTVLADPVRFEQFDRFIAAYHAGNAQEKAAVVASANELFGEVGITVDQLFPKLHDAYELRHLVSYAQDTLQVEGARYARSGYDSPQERFREVISRFAELKQVRLRSAPELVDFICPGLDKIWNDYYIPHLGKVYENVVRTNHVPAAPTGLVPSYTHVGKSDATHLAVAANDTPPTTKPAEQTPAPQPEPKVQELPGTPTSVVANTAVAACSAESGIPENKVHASTIELNSQVVSGLEALKNMGIHYAI